MKFANNLAEILVVPALLKGSSAANYTLVNCFMFVVTDLYTGD